MKEMVQQFDPISLQTATVPIDSIFFRAAGRQYFGRAVCNTCQSVDILYDIEIDEEAIAES